jgi:3-oxoacyl-[acyl-carrier protein] reductase
MSITNRRVALITGGGTGVGRACALRFAKLGYDVIINYSRSESEANETAQEVGECGVKPLVIQCDVSDDGAVRKMIEQVDQTFGRLDVLVNNAATTNFVDHQDLEGLSEEMWDRMLAVNLKGPFFVTRAAAKLLRSSKRGAVVNISSVAGLTGSGSSIAYCASKGGLITMTKSLARVLAPEVTVNAVCPGPIDSRWIRQGNPDWSLDEMVADYPIPRASQPDEIADAVIFFTHGNAMATGQILSVDGGQTLK